MKNDHVLVCSARLSELEKDSDKYHGFLSALERDRAGRYKSAAAAKEFILSRGFLKESIAAFQGGSPQQIEIGLDRNDKPFLVKPANGPFFNLSHSGDWVVIAFTHGQAVGIDIEKIDFQMDLKIAKEVFSPPEIAELAGYNAAEKTTAFFRGWSQKESFIKALGVGLRYPLQTLTVSLDPYREPQILQCDLWGLEQWKLLNLSIDPEYACALFVQNPAPQILFQDYQARDHSTAADFTGGGLILQK